MRIIGGEKRGLKLNELDAEVVCRPTIDRVKEAIFDIIQFEIEGDALDLFAGTGQLGIEALSRGCEKAVFCDNNEISIKLIKANIKKAKYEGKSELLFCDYKKYLKHTAKPDSFKLIFLDPPYDTEYAVKALELIEERQLLKKNGIVVLECGKKEEKPQNIGNLSLKKRYFYGQVSVLIYTVPVVEGD
ncbi:MAG: rRNA ((966)-N(2))-methyltransferase RsmD [Clostridia bacterium]|nr:rRNA ((966)-N(2))-methyltransferase RsmD [Clostridia bacterium]